MSNATNKGKKRRSSWREARIGDTVAALTKSFDEVAALEEARVRDRATYLFDLGSCARRASR